MMKLYGVLVLLVILSTGCGLRCYECVLESDPSNCKTIRTCYYGLTNCATHVVNGLTTKACKGNSACVDPVKCCKTDLCNSAIPTGSSVLLLLVSSAITATFL